MEAIFEGGQGPEGAVVPWRDGWMDGCGGWVGPRSGLTHAWR